MLGHEPLVSGLLDRGAFSLALLDAPPTVSSPLGLRAVSELWARLPVGLVHAEVVELVSDPPLGQRPPSERTVSTSSGRGRRPQSQTTGPRNDASGLSRPLGPGSPWYSGPRSLTVVCGPASCATLILDLSAYRQIGRFLRARLGEGSDLADQLLLEPIPSGALARLAAVLETSTKELSRMGLQTPGLLTDLAWLAKRGFDPEVRVQADLQPRVQRERGLEVADRMAARIASDRFSLLVCDDPTPIELLSPYASDLAGALVRWALENSGRVTTPGLIEALRSDGSRAPRDLAALVISDLFRMEPSLLEERRINEETQGLFLTDSEGAIFGVAEIERLADPDPVLPRKGGRTLAVIAGGGPTFRATAAGRLLESGRVDRTAVVHAVDMDSDRVVVPRSILTPEDGVRLPESGALEDVAKKLGTEVSWVEPLEITGPRASVSPLALILGAHRRAWAADRLDPDAPCFVVLYGACASDRRIHLSRAQARLNAARLALVTVLDSTPGGPPAQSGSTRQGRLPWTRYRA